MRVRMRRVVLVLVLGPAAGGCTLGEGLSGDGAGEQVPVTDAGPSAASAPSDTAAVEAEAPPEELDPAALVGSPEATDLAAAPARLPAGWDGSGVLAKRSGRLPRRAPAWAKVAAQVTQRAGQRYLVTSGRARGIKDAHLARSTAANRAIDELGRWTKSPKHAGGTVREVWRDPRTGETFAQVELPVPAEWAPGTPLGDAGRAAVD